MNKVRFGLVAYRFNRLWFVKTAPGVGGPGFLGHLDDPRSGRKSRRSVWRAVARFERSFS